MPGGSSAAGTDSSASGLIVFVQEPGVLLGSEVYSSAVRGGARNLTRAAGNDEAPLVSPDGKWIAFLRQARGRAGSELCVMRGDGSNLRAVVQLEPSRYGHTLSWSPDSQQLAFDRAGDGTSESVVSILDLRTGSVTPLAFGARAASWSPDGRQLALVREDQAFHDHLVLRALSEGTETTLASATDSSGTRGAPIWSPDGARILFRGKVVELAADTATRLPVGAAHGPYPWSPDGRRLVLGLDVPAPGRPQIVLYDVVTRTTQTLRTLASRVSSPAWSHDGRSVAADTRMQSRSRIIVWPLDGGPERIVADGPFHITYPVSWTPDGTRLVYARRHDDDAELYTMRSDGTRLRRLTDNAIADRRPTWSPDGRSIAFIRGDSDGLGQGQLFRMDADGKHVKRISARPVADASWAPDGKSLATVAYPESGIAVAVVDARSGRSRTVWKSARLCYAPFRLDIRWSPDGTRIAVTDHAACQHVIRLISPDGRTHANVVHGGALDAVSPAWLPNGRLVFVTFLDEGKFGLYNFAIRSSGADGSRPVVVRQQSGRLCDSGRATSAPDGRRLAWTVVPCHANYVDHYPSLRVITLATGSWRMIGYGSDPDWQPRARRIGE